MIIATTFDTYMNESGQDIEKAFSTAKEDGFSAMGIMVKEDIDYYLANKSLFLNSGIMFCVHANLVDTNIASSNEGIRKESIKQLKDAIIIAKEIGAKVVTFHPGKFRNALLIQEAYLLLDMSLNEVMPFAIENGVILCIENMEPMPKELCVTLIQVQKVLERHPQLWLTLDLAHIAMVVGSEEELIDYYNSIKDRIKHFHISGLNPRRSHVEVSLKESDVDFTNVIRLIRDFSGIVRIENRERSKNIESLDFIKKALE